MNVDPVIRKKVGPANDQTHSDEIAIVKVEPRVPEILRWRGIHDADEIPNRQSADEVCAFKKAIASLDGANASILP